MKGNEDIFVWLGVNDVYNISNYISLLKSDMLAYGKNTLILWLIGFIHHQSFAAVVGISKKI